MGRGVGKIFDGKNTVRYNTNVVILRNFQEWFVTVI